MLPISPTNPRLIIQLLSWNYSQKIKHADNGKAVVGYVPNHKYKRTSCAIQCRCTFDQCCKFQEIYSLVQIRNRCQYCKRKRIKRILAYKTKVLRTMLYINSNLGPLGSQAKEGQSRLHKLTSILIERAQVRLFASIFPIRVLPRDGGLTKPLSLSFNSWKHIKKTAVLEELRLRITCMLERSSNE